MTTYIALLRGINVGGNNTVKMETLKAIFESMSFTQVYSVLATGNIVFQCTPKDYADIEKKIEKALREKLGHTVLVIVRSIDSIQALIDSNPFKKIPVTAHTRLYVSFIKLPHKSSLKLPYISPDNELKILSASDTEVCSVLTLSAATKTTEVMNIVEKEFGKATTTRNWNTILKFIKKK